MESMFVGWGILRSNENVRVFQRIKILDPVTDRLVGETHYLGVSNPIQRAEIPVLLPRSSDPGTGIAIVNASDTETLTLEVQYWEGPGNPLVKATLAPVMTVQLEMSPRSKQAFMVPDFSTVWSRGFVRLIAAPEQSFAVTALNVRLHDQFGLSLSPPATYDQAGDGQVHITSDGIWDFGVPVVETVQLRDLEIVLTDFGFFVRDVDNIQGPFHLCNRTDTFVSEEFGLAIVGGRREKSIVFGDSRKVIREVLPGNINSIIDLPEQDWIEIFSALVRSFSRLERPD